MVTPERPGIRSATITLGCVLLALLVVGVVTAGDYGVSWDEPDNAAFGRQALQAYADLRPPAEWQSNLESKGPFFVAAAEAITATVAALGGGAAETGARHLAYFLTLPLAAVGLFSLGLRIAHPWPAFSATMLFIAQPLIYGHAFINPKDTPFMAFFLASMAMGVWMVESRAELVSKPGSLGLRLGLPVVSGVVLGLTTSIRVFGPFAGLLITLFAVLRLKGRGLSFLVPYWIAAAAATYVTWPHLWADPFLRFWESIQVLTDFPWDNLILYRGLAYPAVEIPWHYLPFTTVIQLTLPAMILAVGGSVVGLIGMAADAARRPMYLVLFLWTAIPYGAALLARSEIYDNSRQFLFAIPPLFLAGALAFDGLFSRIRWRPAQAAIAALAVLPGLVAIVRLHPYQYIYYNELVGGVPEAYRQYELDYWATSYRAAMEGLNRLAPPGSTVEVVGPWLAAATFARPDLAVSKFGTTPAGAPAPDYLIVFTRSNADQYLNVPGTTVLQIVTDGAVLSEVRAVGESR